MAIEKELLQKIVTFIEDKKGREVTLLDLRGLSVVTDYFLIVTGNSRVQTKAIAEYVEQEMAGWGLSCLRIEGLREASWVLMDCGDLVIHIMIAETRDFYNLERLWGDAPTVVF